MKTLFKKSIALLFLFIVFSCSKDSPTASTQTSNCPPGYTGTNCNLQITPTKITISKIEILSYPSIDPSALTGYWDYPSNTNPDLAIILTDLSNSTNLLDSTQNPFNNALNNTIYTYNIPDFSITSVNDIFQIQLRDIDTGSSPSYQIMNTYVFSLYSNVNGFPSVIHLLNGETKYNIYVSYTW